MTAYEEKRGYGVLARTARSLWAARWWLVRALRGPGVGPARGGLRILLYHRVASGVGSRLAVLPADFRRQMQAVLASGRCFVPLSQVPALLASGASDLSRYVVVTFDDAYRDDLTRALPILEEFGVPAAVFAATRYADCPAPFPWFPDAVADPDGVPLDWDGLRELAARGVDVESHGLSHASLLGLSDDAVREEFVASAGAIERELRRRPVAFCYPYGHFTSATARLASVAGYACACTCLPGTNGPSTSPFELRRTRVEGGDSLKVFQAALGGAFDWFFPYRSGESIKKRLKRGGYA
jgi:peptidoglycan/xylan/chitin deacetylase (PgdA/CDA1 family)